MAVLTAVSLVSLVVSVVALCLCCPRYLEFDYIGLIVGILALLITVLMAWNIYTVFRFKEDIERITTQKVLEIVKEAVPKAIEENSLSDPAKAILYEIIE